MNVQNQTNNNFAGIEALDDLKLAVNYNHYFEKKLLEFAGQDRELLDFGAGTGEFANRLKNLGYGVDCVEVDPKLTERLVKNNLEVRPSLSSFGKKYNKIYSFHVVEHIEDDVAALREIKNNLTSSGSLFLCVPAFICLYSDFDRKIGHYRRYTKKELVHKLRSVGFKVDDAYYIDFGGFFAIFLWKLLSSKSAEPSSKSIAIYDKYLFPISRIIDRFTFNILGRHLVVFARNSM